MTSELITEAIAIVRAAARPRHPGETDTVVRCDLLRTARERRLVHELAVLLGATKRPAGSADAYEWREGEPVALVDDIEYLFSFDTL